MNLHRILIVAAVCITTLLHAQSPADPISGNLFPSDFILANAQAIGLTDAQQQSLQKAVDAGRPRFAELQKNLSGETAALRKLLVESAPDEAVLAQLDKVQEHERVMKREQMALLLALRSDLTAEQRKQLSALRIKHGGLLQRIPDYTEKKDRITAGVRKWQGEGRDIAPVTRIMSQVHPLLLDGKMEQANALLDEALKVLEKGSK